MIEAELCGHTRTAIVCLNYALVASQIRQIQPDDYMESLLQKGCPFTGGSLNLMFSAFWWSQRGFSFADSRLVSALAISPCILDKCVSCLHCQCLLQGKARKRVASPCHSPGVVLGVSYAVRHTKVRKLVSSREQTTCQIETHTLRLIMTIPICWLKCPGSGFQSMWTYSLEWPGSSLYSTWSFCYPSTEI